MMPFFVQDADGQPDLRGQVGLGVTRAAALAGLGSWGWASRCVARMSVIRM